MRSERAADIDLSSTSFLVAEDNLGTQKVLRKILEAAGAADIRFATDGNQALQLLKNWVPDIILCDWNMAPMNGKSLLATLHADPGVLSEIPVIVVTSTTDKKVVQQIIESEPEHLVLKPIVPARLYNRIGWVQKKLQENAARSGGALRANMVSERQPETSPAPDSDETWLL